MYTTVEGFVCVCMRVCLKSIVVVVYNMLNDAIEDNLLLTFPYGICIRRAVPILILYQWMSIGIGQLQVYKRYRYFTCF